MLTVDGVTSVVAYYRSYRSLLSAALGLIGHSE